MYARVTTLTAKPDRINQLAGQLGALKAQMKSVAGLKSNTLAWRADGRCVVMAVYESQAAAEAAAPQIRSVLASLADALVGAPQVEVFDNADDLLS